MYTLNTHSSISEIPEEEWDARLGPGEPFLRWAFLRGLERCGCVAPEKGWSPCYLSLKREGARVAVAPAYVKGNSEGEFVFDHSWAEFSCSRLQSEYYPKLIVASPFTPATGRRLLAQGGTHEAELVEAFAAGVRGLCEQANLSGAHVLFPRESEAQRLASAGLLLRHGVQFHWFNPGYGSFEDFLVRYPSKKRSKIRRERRALTEQGLRLRVFTGTDITPEIIDHMYDFYTCTVDKHVWGRRYLNRAFFEVLGAEMGEQVVIVLAYRDGERTPIAGALNYKGGGRLFGRYWGAREDVPFLHFNVCYYEGIDYCIAERLECFEPGAGGEHKIARGFEPTLTYSAHHLRHPILAGAVQDFLQRERAAVRQEVEAQGGLLKPFVAPKSNEAAWDD